MSPLRLFAGAALVVLLGACGVGGSTTVVFSCVAPHLDTTSPGASEARARMPVRPGDSLTLYGHVYTTTCNDTGGDDPLAPVPPVHLTVTWPGGATQDLGDVSPAGDMGFSVVVRVPVGTPPGMARVRDDGGWSTPYRFQVEQSTARMHSSPPAGADEDE